MAQPAISNTHCGTEFVTPRNMVICAVMPNQAPTASVFSELVRTHNHQVLLFNEYHAVDRACKKVIRKLIPEKFYKLGVTSLDIITHLITKYAELEEEEVQDIDRKMKEPISGKTLFEEFDKQIEWNQEAVAVQNPYSPSQIVSMAYANIEKCGLYQDDCQEWSRKTRSEKNVEQLQGSLRSGLQGDLKILNGIEWH